MKCKQTICQKSASARAKMCGIICVISNSNSDKSSQILEKSNHILRRRGPDYNNSVNIINGFVKCSLEAHVLWQQGDTICNQPVRDENLQNILIFNGDIFSSRENITESDTEWLFAQLNACCNESDIINLFKQIKGPFSFIYLKVQTSQIWFARDSLGRNSLLLGRSKNNEIILSSTISRSTVSMEEIIELPPLGLFNLCMDDSNKELNLFPWIGITNSEMITKQIKKIESVFKSECHLKTSVDSNWLAKCENEITSFNFQSLICNNIFENNIFDYLLKNHNISSICDKIIMLLKQSIKERIINTPDQCKNCISLKEKCDHPKIGILFSGGIDCTVIALLADEFVNSEIPIDFINVAFEKYNSKIIDYDVPDRITAKLSLGELQNLLPQRKLNLIEVNVKRDELELELSSRISDLIFPLNTVLDESLGAALWFAARGKGFLNDEHYQSPCRVLLLGSGADELFGGYTRHRNAFLRESNSESNTTLKSELELDFQRLPSRNLARDDRVICDHGITPRTPYLQEDLVHFIRNLEPLQKCYHNLEQGIGDKLLLRLCGYKLGLRNCTQFKKRALQFGSRIAIPKQNANDISQYLK